MKQIINNLSGRVGSPSRSSVGAIRDRTDLGVHKVGQASSLSSVEQGFACIDRLEAYPTLKKCDLEQNVLHLTSHNSHHLPSRRAAKCGFSLIEVMVAAVLGVIVVWAAGTQIVNVLSYHNEYRIDAMLLEDLTRVANGVQSRIEMCTSWDETSPGSGIWEGIFPVQVNGVAFETNRYMNVVGYQLSVTNGAFVERIIRNPQGGLITNMINRFIANEPGVTNVNVSSTVVQITGDVVEDVSPSAVEGVYRAEFSASAEWSWLGRTHTNRVTVPRIIVLYNKN